ncbi:hypothetical protein AB0U69_002317 [Listeria monocytogenes]
MKKVNKIKKTTKKVVKTVKKAGTKVINKATSKIKTIGKKANAIIATGKEAAAKEALCKNQEFLESQKKGYSDPTYDYKNGYPRPGEAWAFDANGNIDKEKSAEVAEKIGEWSTYSLMLVIPGPEELLITGILVKVGGKVGPKIISWGANKFGAKEAKVFNEPKGVGNPVKIEGRGSTGSTKPINLDEQMAMHQVQSNPMKGAYEVKSIEMTDKRWLGKNVKYCYIAR